MPLHKIKGFRQRFAGKEIFADNVEFFTLPRKLLDNFTLERALEVGAKLFERVALKSVDMNNFLAYFLDLRDKTQFAVRFQFIIGAENIRLTYEKKIFNAIQLKTAQQARKSLFLTSLTILKKGTEI